MYYDFKKQEKDNWCFPACLQMVLDRHELCVPQRDIASGLGITNGNGFHAAEFVLDSYLKRFGLSSEIVEARTYFFGDQDLIEENLKIERDNIVMVHEDGRRHYVVVSGACLGEVEVVDPDIGVRSFDWREFFDLASSGCYVLVGGR